MLPVVLPGRRAYRICPLDVSARLVGVPPIGIGFPMEALSGLIARMELEVTEDVPAPMLAMILREYGS